MNASEPPVAAPRPDGDAQVARIVVTRGGNPGAHHLAALVVAISPPTGDAPPTEPPAWRQAALVEGIGRADVLAPSDLRVRCAGP